MEAFEIGQLIEQQKQAGKAYLEFLRQASLSMGVYRLPAGGVDPQSPHTEEEVYYVVDGKAQIRVGDEDRSVNAGSIVFVAANVPAFVGASQIYADPFVFILLGSCLGFVLAVPRIVTLGATTAAVRLRPSPSVGPLGRVSTQRL